MPSGKVKWFDQKKGYGFIKEQDTDRDIFLHISALEKSKLRILNYSSFWNSGQLYPLSYLTHF